VRELAELVYDVLSECVRLEQSPPVLVALNKSELAGAAGPEQAKAALEVEMDALKQSRHTLATEGQEGGEIVLGTEGANFEFDADAGCDVQFASVSVKVGGARLEPIVNFISAAFGPQLTT
jgi:hypothetical protein